MDSPKQISGFIHNVSPLKKSSKATYFDLVIQTKDDTVRAICFSPKKHNDLQMKSKASSPVKLANFRIKDDGSPQTILMDNKLELHDTEVDFPVKSIPTTNSISSLSEVHYQQLITIKGKVVQLSGIKKVNTRNGLKQKTDCYLTDPTGSIKLTLWEDFVNDVQEGKTYTFNNVRVIKEYNTDRLALGTSLQDCTVTESEDFSEPLSQPVELPDAFTSTETQIEIIGVTAFGRYLCCQNCNKKIADESFHAKVLKCRNCSMTQRKDKCIIHCYAQTKVSEDGNKFILTFFHQEIQQIMSSLSLQQSLNEE